MAERAHRQLEPVAAVGFIVGDEDFQFLRLGRGEESVPRASRDG
jgi:hypothetical protein